MMSTELAKYSIIIPVFNETAIILNCYSRLKKTFQRIDGTCEMIFINDGSTDNSEKLIKDLNKKDSNVKLISFSRNFGHQVAITAGLEYASGDAIIIIDADMQDPPEIIPRMIEKWKEGYEVIYGKRIKRKGETVFKKVSAFLFYRLLKYITRFDIPVDTGDFRLLDKKVRDQIVKFHEKSRYIRGLISWVGFKQTFVEYERDTRQTGTTKYSLKKMVYFAMDAITSFSYRPLRLSTYLGFILSFFSFTYVLYAIYSKLFTNNTVQGWTSAIAISLFFNGVILIILGILGEYIGRIYEEAKGRPLYILREKIGFE